jgi:hypothetical protein
MNIALCLHGVVPGKALQADIFGSPLCSSSFEPFQFATGASDHSIEERPCREAAADRTDIGNELRAQVGDFVDPAEVRIARCV